MLSSHRRPSQANLSIDSSLQMTVYVLNVFVYPFPSLPFSVSVLILRHDFPDKNSLKPQRGRAVI